MTESALHFPHIDPVAFNLGPLSVHWYALAYIISIYIGWKIAAHLVALPPQTASREQIDDFVFWAMIGVVLGGRLGYVLFYQPGYYLNHPAAVLQVWNGGMSFHGGAIGVILTLAFFSWRNGLNFLAFSDRIVPVVPIGLGLGRCANFINGELWGRSVTHHIPWAMIFPNAGPMPRHPSELYEALMEGVVLLAVMLWAVTRPRLRARYGFLSGLFLLGYAVARSFCEMFREPDAFIGYLPFGVTMGQVLSIPMAIAGIGLMLYALRHPSQFRAAKGEALHG